jgi:hypothetical protein
MQNLTQLKVLDAVARHGSVTEAAKELHYSQSSVSHQWAAGSDSPRKEATGGTGDGDPGASGRRRPTRHDRADRETLGEVVAVQTTVPSPLQ